MSVGCICADQTPSMIGSVSFHFLEDVALCCLSQFCQLQLGLPAADGLRLANNPRSPLPSLPLMPPVLRVTYSPHYLPAVVLASS